MTCGGREADGMAVGADKDSFVVLEEPLQLARDEAIAVLNATRRHGAEHARFDWMYRNNPDGEAVLWTLRDAATGEMAGFTVALPRRILVDGQLRVCWNGADFSVLPKYRTLGLAVKLRRAAKEGIDAGRADFLYAHPNDRMAVIHARVGHLPVGNMYRYVKVLRTAGYLGRKIPSERAAAVAGAAIDPIVRLAGRESRHRPTTKVRLVRAARFDDRYDKLFDDAACGSRVIGVRDARYLNWRYAENPIYETHVLEAQQGKQLRGYLLFTVKDGVAQVKDLFPPHDAVAARDLIAGLIVEARKRRLSSASVVTLEGNLVDPLFAEFGFRLRPGSSQMFAYAAAESPCRDAVLDSKSWFLTVGDRDV